MKKSRHWIEHPYFPHIGFMAVVGGASAGICLLQGGWIRALMIYGLFEFILRILDEEARRRGDW